MKKTIICIAILLAVSMAAYASVVYFKKFDFNDDKALNRWEQMVLNGKVKYSLAKDHRNGFVEAYSDKACSALYYRVGFKSKDYPLLSWRWNVVKFPDKSQARTEKEKNDYAARVYVIFPFLSFSSSKFIEYVWDENLPEGTVMTSPLGSNIKMIVVQSGHQDSGQWVNEKRNIYDDYVTAFGKKPNLNVGAIAMMCNADNTKTDAQALFDEITIANNAGVTRRLD